MAIGNPSSSTAIGVTVTSEMLLQNYKESPILRSFNTDFGKDVGLLSNEQLRAGSVRIGRIGAINRSEITSVDVRTLNNTITPLARLSQGNTEVILRVKRATTQPRVVSDFEERMNSISGFLSRSEVEEQVGELQQQMLRDLFASIYNGGKDATGATSYGGLSVPGSNRLAWQGGPGVFGYNDIANAKDLLDLNSVPANNRFMYYGPGMYRRLLSDTVILGFLQNQMAYGREVNETGRIPNLAGFEALYSRWIPLTNSSGQIPESSAAFFVGDTGTSPYLYSSVVLYHRDAIVLSHSAPRITIDPPSSELAGDASYSTQIDYIFGVIRPEAVVISYDNNA